MGAGAPPRSTVLLVHAHQHQQQQRRSLFGWAKSSSASSSSPTEQLTPTEPTNVHRMTVADKRKYAQLVESAQSLVSNGKFAEAIETSTEAIVFQPGRMDGFFIRGVAYWRQGNATDALADLNEAVLLDPNNPDLYDMRAYLRHHCLQHREAIEDFSTAIRLDASLAIAFHGRGLAYSHLDEHENGTDSHGIESTCLTLTHTLALSQRLPTLRMPSDSNEALVKRITTAVSPTTC